MCRFITSILWAGTMRTFQASKYRIAYYNLYFSYLELYRDANEVVKQSVTKIMEDKSATMIKQAQIWSRRKGGYFFYIFINLRVKKKKKKACEFKTIRFI